MSSTIRKPSKQAVKSKLTLQALHAELTELRERVEDLEDLRELNHAIERNKDKPLLPWAEAKKSLGWPDFVFPANSLA
jgi:hypothetical protein